MIETAIEVAVAAAAGIPAARVLTTPAARRELRRRGPLCAAVAVVAALAVAGTAWAAIASADALRGVAAFAALAWAVGAWTARPDHGRRRGLPPGSLAWRASLLAISDRSFLEHQTQRYGTVFKFRQLHRPVACLVDLHAGRELLRQNRGSLRPPALPLSAELPRGFLRYMEPADHELYGPLFRPPFSAAAVKGTEAGATEVARRELAALAAAAREDGSVEPRAAVQRYVTIAVLRFLFGELFDEQDAELIERLHVDATAITAFGRAAPRARRALHEFHELLGARHADRGGATHGTPWEHIVQAYPAAADDLTVTGNLFVFGQSSRESIGGLSLWAMKQLGGAPEWADRLRDELDRGIDGGLVDRILSETLRLAQSEYVYRQVTRPIDVGGYRIPRGWRLRICVAEAHRLDPPFADPARFDPGRFEGRRYTVDEFSPFGLDHHACLGARLTMLLARVLVDELVRGYAWHVVADGPPQRGNRHWAHWTPNADFRIALTERVPAIVS